MLLIIINGVNGVAYQIHNSFKGKIEGIDRAFHTLHKIYSSKTTDTLFTTYLGKTLVVIKEFCILFYLAIKYVHRWCVYRKS